ncbi:MAG: serpin family protein [Bacteroidales bacterium]
MQTNIASIPANGIRFTAYLFLKTFVLPMVILFPFLVTSCDIFDPGDNPPKPIEMNKKAAEIIDAGEQFAFDLFHQTCSLSTEENIMISPLSVSYALGMTYNGAADSTLEAFKEVLHFGELTNQEVNETYKDLMGQLVHLDDDVEFSIANSIWYRLGANVLEEFITTNQEYFDAAIRELDFSDPKSVDIINDWIAGKTNDKIQDMLDFIPPDVYMYLVNAIYFNATWKYEFDKDDTYSGTFYKEDETTSQADFMKLKGDFYYTSHSGYSAVELPYGDSAFSMVALLPAEGSTLSELIAMLDMETWKARSTFSSPQEVQVELPKFKYEFKILMNDHLSNLGLGVAFGGGADFSRITEETDLFISRVIHQTFIDVSEEGTEAAAATIVELRETSIQIPETIRFNRPFLYIIKENSTGAIMFMGKVGNPQAG